MAGVLIRRGDYNTVTHKKRPCEETWRGWPSTSQGGKP